MRGHNARNAIVGGMMWKFAERILSQGVAFLISLVLARLLSPDDYGIIALVLVFINLAGVFISSGFSTALVQKKDADETDFSTMFYCSLLCSAALYGLLFLLAPLVARFYENPVLTNVLRVFSLQIPLSVYNSIQVAYVSRHMQFKKLFFSSAVSAAVSGAVGIAMAWMDFGVWALVFQALSTNIVGTIVLFFLIPWRPVGKFSMDAAKSLMKYGSRVLLADLSGTFFSEIRSLLIGRVYTSADLAFYTKGQQLPTQITGNLSSTIISVLFPALSNESGDTAQVKRMTRRSMRVLSYILIPCLFGMAAVMEPLVLLLYSEKWAAIIPYGQVFCVGCCLSVFGIVSLQVLKAIGRSDVVLSLEFIKKPVYLLLLIVGVKIDVFAVAVTLMLYDLYGMIVNMFQLKTYIGYSLRQQLRDLAPAFLLGAVMAAVVYLIPSFGSLVLTLLVKVAVGAAVYVLGSVIFRVDSFAYLKDILAGLLHRGSQKRRNPMTSGLRRLAVWVCKMLLFLCPVKKRKVLFINFNGRGYGCNPKYIAQEMLAQKLDCDMVWLVNDLDEPFPAGIRKVRFRSLRGLYEVATARVIVTNVKNDLHLQKKKGQYIIQTWHSSYGGKPVEQEAADKLPRRYLKESRKNSAQTDLFLSNSRVLSQCYRDAFWCRCEILECGFPRNDILFCRQPGQTDAIREKLGVPKDAKLALYAPTFRDDGSTGAYDLDCAGVLNTLRQKGGSWYLLVRLHPNVDSAKDLFPFGEDVIDATPYPDMQELLLASDVLITDYSSTVFEFSAMGKPCFLYASDLEDYQTMRGLKEDYFLMPYPVCRTNDELLSAIRACTAEQGREAAARFMAQFGGTDKGDASRQVTERIKQLLG